MSYRIQFISILFSLCLISFVTRSQERKINEKLLANVDGPDLMNNTFSFSPDFRSVAFRAHQDNKQTIIINGKKGNLYDAVGTPVFTRDGKHFAYSAHNGNNWFLILDGQEKAIEESSIISGYVFSPDNKNIAFIINDGHKQRINYKGIDGNKFDYINENSINFSSDGVSLAYSAQKDNKHLIVFNGDESTPYDEVGFPVMSPDGQDIAFWAVGNKKVYVVNEGRESEPYDNINSIFFSRNGKHIAWHAVRNGKHFMVIDGDEKEKYDLIHSPCFSTEGNHLAYAVELSHGKDEDESEQCVVLDGKKQKEFETIIEGSILFSHDGKELAYKAEEHDEFFMVVNDKEGKHYSDVLQVTSVFSNDNSRFAYVAEVNSKRMVNADGLESSSYNNVYSIAFGPQKTIAFAANRSNKDFVVVDGQESRPYEMIMGQGEIVFDSDDSFHYIALRDNGIYLVEESF